MFLIGIVGPRGRGGGMCGGELSVSFVCFVGA